MLILLKLDHDLVFFKNNLKEILLSHAVIVENKNQDIFKFQNIHLVLLENITCNYHGDYNDFSGGSLLNFINTFAINMSRISILNSIGMITSIGIKIIFQQSSSDYNYVIILFSIF